MRTFLYTTIESIIQSLRDEQDQPLIATFDLWNEQVDFIEQETPFATPAVFIHFLDITYRRGTGVTQATVPFRLHVVTPWAGSIRPDSPFRDDNLRRFRLLQQVADAMLFTRASATRYSLTGITHQSSSTNHNHEDLVEDIELFQAIVFDSGPSLSQKATADGPLPSSAEPDPSPKR